MHKVKAQEVPILDGETLRYEGATKRGLPLDTSKM
jgi:hypothetical protein